MGTAACFLIVLPIASRLRCNSSVAQARQLPLQGSLKRCNRYASLVKGDSPQCGEMWRSDKGDGHRYGGGTTAGGGEIKQPPTLQKRKPHRCNSWVYVRQYCAEIDEAARNRMELIVPELAKQYGVTEQLKAENQMEWVRQMNACKAQAEEIVKAELIYG